MMTETDPKSDSLGVLEENKENADEYLISADPSKYVTLPVQNEQIWRKYQTTLDLFWTAHDVYLADDRKTMLDNFNEEQREYILKMIALMLVTHHTTINKELFMHFMNQVEIKEASYFFGSQADAKKTHSTMYSMLLDELSAHDQDKRVKVIEDVVKDPIVRDFLRWSIINTNSGDKGFAHRLLAFATLQGIIFTGTFVLIKWIEKQHPSFMSGLAKSNDKIWRDEKLNLAFSCSLFDHIDNDLSREEAQAIVQDAVSHAKNLLTKYLPVSIVGMDIELMAQLIEHSADTLLSDIGVEKLYHKECPFDWAIESATDGHKGKIHTTNYVDLSVDYGDANFSTDIEF